MPDEDSPPIPDSIEAQAKVPLRSNNIQVSLGNSDIAEVFTALENKTYEASSYNPSAFFNAIVDSNAHGTQKEFRLNAAVMGQALNQVGQDGSLETRQALAHRLAGYQMKFAPSNDASLLGAQNNPLQAGDRDQYMRGGHTKLTIMADQEVAKSLGVSPNNIHTVTDGRVMEVLKRNYAMEDRADVQTWGEENLGKMYEQMKGEQSVLLDVTPFLASTMRGHENGEVADAIGVTNEFMHDAIKGSMRHFQEEDPAFKDLSAEDKDKARQKLDLSISNNLTLGAMIMAGEQPALYTCSLGKRTGPPGNEVFEEGMTHQPKRFAEHIAHNGFTLGPQQLLENWARGAQTPEQMLGLLDDMAMMSGVEGGLMRGVGSIQMPKDAAGLAKFKDTEEFFSTKIFQQFQQLGADEHRAPYVRITASATAAMMEEMKQMELHDRFGEQGLDPVLQMSYNRMQAAMQTAVAKADDPGSFNEFVASIECVHEQMANVLTVAKPYSHQQFNAIMNEATNILPENFPEGIQPQFTLKNSGLRGLSATISATEALKGEGRKLNIAMQKDAYYESGSAVDEARNHAHLTLDGDALDASIQAGAEQLGGEKLDVYVAEFHHNISASRTDYHAEDVTAQVDKLFEKGLVSDKFTVALDTTIATTDAAEIKAFLDHNKARIAEGKLNVVMYRSGQKFDLMGMDNYNGGVVVTVNNGRDFGAFNATMDQGRGQDSLGDLSLQGFTLAQKQAQTQLNAYRGAVMGATLAMASPRTAENPAGLPQSMKMAAGAEGAAMIQMAVNSDDKAVFLDLRNPWLEAGSDPAQNFNKGMAYALTELSRQEPQNYHIEGKASFGFIHSNVTVIGGDKFRFNPGLEGEESLKRYADTFAAMNEVMMQSRADYPDPDDFNAINCNLTEFTNQAGNFLLLTRQQMQKAEGKELSPSQHLEAAKALHAVGNQRAAARTLEALGKNPALTKDQAREVKDLQKTVQAAALTPPGGPAKRSPLQAVHENTADMRAMLRQGAVTDPRKMMAAMGKAEEAFIKLGNSPADARAKIQQMLTAELKILPPGQLSTVEVTASRLAAGMADNSPQRTLLTTVGRLAGQQHALAEAQGLVTGQDASSRDFLKAANIRARAEGEQEKTPRSTLGDIYSSFNSYAANPNRAATEPDAPGDRVIARGGKSPEEKLMDAIVGSGVKDILNTGKTLSNQDVIKGINKLVSALPPEQQLMTSNTLGNLGQLADRGLRTMHVSYQGMMKEAAAGNTNEFLRSAREFEASISNLQRETAFIGKLLTDPANLGKLPKEHRDVLVQYGENARAIGDELERRGGFGQMAQQYATQAIQNPQVAMAQVVQMPGLGLDQAQGTDLKTEVNPAEIEVSQEMLDNAPSYPAPPPPGVPNNEAAQPKVNGPAPKQPKVNIRAKDRDAGAGVEPQVQAPVQVGTAPLDQEAIDKGIAEALKSQPIQPGEVTDYKALASAAHDTLRPPKEQSKADTAVIEAQLIDKHEIQPLNQRIEALEQQISQLEQVPEAGRDVQALNAGKAELEELYEDLDTWEARVGALKVSMAAETPKNRLAAINAAQQVENISLASKPDQEARLEFTDDTKLNDANPRQEHELQVGAANAAKNFIGKVPDAGIEPGRLKDAISQAYGRAYAYDGPERLKEDGSEQRVKGANERGISGPEKERLAAEMQPMIDQVNALQATITPLEGVQAALAADIRGDLQADPAKIEDAQTRQDFQKAQEDLDSAATREKHCEAKLKSLESPGRMESLKARVQHGGVEQARQHYQDEKKAAAQARSEARGQLNAALDKATSAALQKNPEAQNLAAEIGGLKTNQTKLLQDFHDTKQAAAAAIKPERVQGQQNGLNAQPVDPNAHMSVKSAMKASAKVETNDGTLANEAARQARKEPGPPQLDGHKPSVSEILKRGLSAPQPGGHQEAQGQGDHSLRGSWKPATPSKPSPKAGGSLRASS